MKLPLNSPVTISSVKLMDNKDDGRCWKSTWTGEKWNRQNNVYIQGSPVKYYQMCWARPGGQMDMVPVFGTGDCRFESYPGFGHAKACHFKVWEVYSFIIIWWPLWWNTLKFIFFAPERCIFDKKNKETYMKEVVVLSSLFLARHPDTPAPCSSSSSTGPSVPQETVVWPGPAGRARRRLWRYCWRQGRILRLLTRIMKIMLRMLLWNLTLFPISHKSCKNWTTEPNTPKEITNYILTI